ncbi:major histocompatibility complex class I-related gene protein-like isoform X2 [Megalops cyprinoides]|uniref:major histocompatibility complex class I-related gene protein-like isoform X2 n=1 Tax=Megalops cyprinoides TaxID=118141 RepID=UPI001864CECC|nr:major histocompatibility complex class I-related gene protein-like isoform X2 [Megalops cyprinoides]
MHWSPRVASLTLVQLLFYLKAGSPVSVSHSLRHYLMATPTGSGLPRFLEVGLLDGMPFFRYDSNVGRAVALSPWFSDFVIGREGDQLNWDMQTAQQILTRGLGEAMHRFNHTGIHVFQGTLGCELLSNGLPRPFLSYSYDGSDFISYEPSTRTWTPAQPQAFVYKQLREADLDYQPVLDSYYGAVCVAHLREFLDHAGDVLKETGSHQGLYPSPPENGGLGFGSPELQCTQAKRTKYENSMPSVSASTTHLCKLFRAFITL